VSIDNVSIHADRSTLWLTAVFVIGTYSEMMSSHRMHIWQPISAGSGTVSGCWQFFNFVPVQRRL
jgi:hypothetical protein